MKQNTSKIIIIQLKIEREALKKETDTASKDRLEKLQKELAELDPQEGEDDVPETPEVPISRPGDLWQLGPHRIICGDVREGSVIEALMESDRARMVFADPPYKRIDALAARGALFEDVTAQSSWTLPSMASMLSVHRTAPSTCRISASPCLTSRNELVKCPCQKSVMRSRSGSSPSTMRSTHQDRKSRSWS